jgi:glycosyltransferase involved in cell wall biosynthesis
LNSIWRLFGLNDSLVKNNISVFHGLSAELPVGLNKNIKTVVTIHDLIFLTHPHLYQYIDRKIYYWKTKYALTSADKVIAISEQTKSDCIKYFDVDPSKIEVIYQGCQQVFKEKYAENDRETVIQKYSLPKKFILNVGTIETRKNALTIVKTIKNIDISLVIVGKKKKYYKEIENYILDNKLTSKIIFLDGISAKDLAILYQTASIFMYPSLYEGFGIPIIEALYSGTPVITTKGGCFEEAGGPNSIYINPKDENELSDKINLLLHDVALSNHISSKGKEYANNFNDEIIGQKILTVYECLIGQKLPLQNIEYSFI